MLNLGYFSFLLFRVEKFGYLYTLKRKAAYDTHITLTVQAASIIQPHSYPHSIARQLLEYSLPTAFRLVCVRN